MKKLPILWIRKHEFESLPEYSTSFPTGTTIGKRWKSLLWPGKWVVREYVNHPDPGKIGIKTYRPILT